MPGEPRTTPRRFWIAVGLATCVGFLLRFDLFGQLGLNQFDEGMYAFAAGWAFDRRGLAGLDPGLIPYAPPGYPILVGLISALGIPSDQACFLASALAGASTIPAVAALARSHFGERAAMASAWCVCCSGPHIAFSRCGLTDASFLLAWALGLLAGARFLVRPGWGSAAIMGLFVGLAQEFKYNGWLLGATVLATAASCVLRPIPGQPGHFGRLIGRGLLGAAVAAVVVAPWYAFVENHGGYAGLLAHQRSYLGGWSGWWPHLVSQAEQAVALSGPTWLTVLGAAAIGISQAWPGSSRSAQLDRSRLATFVVAAAISLALAAVPATTVLIAIWLEGRTAEIGRRFVLIGGAILFVLTPFYHPYARLWLPFELIHWLALGSLVARLAEKESIASNRWFIAGSRSRFLAVAGAAFVVLVWGPGFPLARPGPIGHRGLFAPSDSLRRLADDLAGVVPADAAEVRTLVRPAMSYYLGGRVPARSHMDLATLAKDPGPKSWALVDSTVLGDGRGGTDLSGLLGDGRSTGAAWELVARFDASNSLITTLDLDPSARSGQGGCTAARFWLLRPRSKGTSE